MINFKIIWWKQQINLSNTGRIKKKIDLAASSKEYEELVQYQESDVLKAYLSLSSSSVVRN